MHRINPNQAQGIGHQKYPTYVYCRTPSPKFSSVSLYNPLFSRYCTFYDFPIVSHVKISKCHKIFNRWHIGKTFITLYFHIAALLIMKFGSDWIKSVGGVAFWNFQPHMVLLTKISKCHKNFNFWQSAKTFITFSHDYLIYHKVWLRSDDNCRRSRVLTFFLP